MRRPAAIEDRADRSVTALSVSAWPAGVCCVLQTSQAECLGTWLDPGAVHTPAQGAGVATIRNGMP